TTLTLQLPANVVSTRGLLLRCAQSIFAISVDAVERALRISGADVAECDGRPVVRGALDAPIPLCDLSGAFDRGQAPATPVPVVVVQKGPRQLALTVDEVLHEAELVIRPLPWNVRGVASVSGAVILADGQIAMLLDVDELVERGAD